MSTRLSMITALVAVATLGASPASASPRPPDTGVVRIDSGWLRGGVADDHVTYSAIPYAAPPVGELRWRPPAPPAPWSGVRDATGQSTPCPQRGRAGLVGSEDCLQLDVTVPRDNRSGSRTPVLVWLHGGGFTSGGAREYKGVELATTGGMVVVTINYRLGALGFLSAPRLDPSGGNYGLMDQTAALRWVHRNAARFGGDPGNVTLAGQSAGARAVCAQLASPAARGLFHRAIIQSGACDNPVLTLDQAQRFGTRATEELGCATATDPARCLRERDPAELLTTLATVGQDVTGRTTDRPWGPVAGTPVLPRQPRDALRTGYAARVPLLIGGTHDEMRAFVSDEAALTAQEYHATITGTFGDDAAAVLAEYPVTAYDSPAIALATVLGDWGGSVGACPVLDTAKAAAAHQPIYAYEFTENSGQSQDDYPLGSYHGLDLPYVWELDTAWNPYPELTPHQQDLSATITRFWAAFAHTGNPNTPAQPRWPRFGPANTVIALSANGIAPVPYAAEHHCDFWTTTAG